MNDVRIAPIQMSEELQQRIQAFAKQHGGMSFAAAVRFLVTKGLEQVEREQERHD